MKKEQKKSILSNKAELKEKALKSLRTSFEIEGIYFTDKQFQELVTKANKERILA